MRLEHGSEEKLKKDVLRIIGKHLDLSKHKVFVFGSRVTGKGDDRSDIDIGIEGDKEIPLEIIGKIKDEAEELPTLYKIDIVDFSQLSDKFKEVAKEKIEVINP